MLKELCYNWQFIGVLVFLLALQVLDHGRR